jgi:Cu+-exporting ATPase
MTNTVQDNITQLSLSGVTCAGCVGRIEKALNQAPGVVAAQVNFASRTAEISGGNAQQLITAVQDAGYDAQVIEDPLLAEEQQAQELRKLLKSRSWYAAWGVGLGIGLMLFGMEINDPLILRAVGWLTLAMMVMTGEHFYKSGFKALKSGHANMDTLIAIGTSAAWLYSILVVYLPNMFPEAARGVYFEAAVMIIGLVNLGQVFEMLARSKTQSSLKNLLGLRPTHACLVGSGGELMAAEAQVDIIQVKVGDWLRIKPGERVPVDGKVTQGESYFDEAMLTGEPMPVLKQQGDEVVAGTINGQGSVIYEATRVGRDTALARIIEMVRQAQNSKPSISRLADKVAAIFVPVVIVLAVITALVWYFFGPQPALTYSLISAVSVLIIACPCALGLATPISVMIGVGKAAQMGVLVRNADALQQASNIDWVVMDKTGTITQGHPSVENYAVFNGADEMQSLVISETLERASEHPIALAIVAYCQQQLTLKKPDAPYIAPESVTENFTSVQGMGVVSGDFIMGNAKMMQAHKVDLSTAKGWLESQEQAARSLVLLANKGQLVAAFALEDALKEDSVNAVQRLKAQGIKVMMLTGDNQATAQRVASLVAVDDYAGELMPQDKLDKIKQLQNQGLVVAMVGDGINDAPALSQADVGFAMGQGADVAIESADLCLLNSSLHGVADAIELSHATLLNIKQNLWGAFAYNTLGIPIAAGVLFPLTGMLLSPMLAALAMSLSSVTVVMNANRLRLFKPSPRN